MQKIVLLSSILAFCAQAYAYDDHHHGRRCKASDLNGRWIAYQGTVAVPEDGKLHTGVCDFTVLNGTATGSCNFYDANPAPFFSGAFQGEATVSEDCAAEVTMDFAPAPFVSAFHLHLHRDKQSFVGRWDNTAGAFGTSNGVKR